MKIPAIPENDQQRIRALESYQVLDTLSEADFDNITFIASQICKTPISLISLIDQDRQWFKAKTGLSVSETPRDLAYCAHAINQPDSILEVEDARTDERFIDNPLLTGSPNVVFYTGVPLVDADGFALGTLCVIDHIPKKLDDGQLNALRALAHQVVTLFKIRKQKGELEFYESVVEESSEGFAWVEKSGRIRNFNKRYSQLTGIRSEILKAKKVYDFDPNFSKSTWDQHWQDMLAQQSKTFETEFAGTDGTIRTVELRLKMTTVNGDNLISAIVLDVSSRKLSKQKIIENSYFIEKVQSIAKIGYWELDLEQNSVYWSDETKRIHDVDQNYLPDLESGLNFYDEQSRPVISQKVEEAIKHGSSFDVSLAIITHEKRKKWVRSVGKAHFENGKAVKLIGVFQDITAETLLKKDLETKHQQAQAASIAKNRFLSTMSHEIRTPLNAIIGVSYILQNRSPQTEQLEYLDILNKSSKHLLSLLNNVLDFEKLEEGKVVLENINFNLIDLAESVIKSWEVVTKDKGIDLLIDTQIQPDFQYLGDATRLRQILNNLLSNAVKFTDSGSITLILKVLRESASTHTIEILVKDTGIGISKSKLDAVLSEFVQADKSITRKYGGSGLGLAISNNLLQLMDSNLKIESQVGTGSTFSFALELQLTTLDPQIPNSDLTRTKSSSALKGKVILLVEDNDFNRKIGGDLLQTWGAHVVFAEDGQEAIALAASEVFDLILMDLQMPVLDGYSATREIRKLEGKYFQSVPIVALTASALASSHNSVIEAGMNEFVSKPFDPQELFKVLISYTRQKNGLHNVKHLSNFDYLRMLTGNNRGKIAAYLKAFADGMVKDIDDVKIDHEAVRELLNVIHKNKSALKSLGLLTLADQAAKIESSLKNNADDQEAIQEGKDFVLTELTRAQMIITKILKYYK